MPRGSGQGTTLTPEVSRAIVDALKDGAFFKQAATYAGVSPRTAEDWLYKGRQDGADEVFAAFAEEVEKATAVFEVEALRELKAIAAKSGDWRPILEVLKRRSPERWGDTQRIEMAVEKLAREEIAREVLQAVEDVVSNQPGLGDGVRKALLAAVLERLSQPGGAGGAEPPTA